MTISVAKSICLTAVYCFLNTTLCKCLVTLSYVTFFSQLAHPVLESLKGTENQWLIDLLFAFNSGDIARFKALTNFWQTQVSGLRHSFLGLIGRVVSYLSASWY